ncbi:DNHD1 [Cordylochernes scorpioides]|uniref:DNHD1 n=1 Tax=Cordylochernes scorpioides TaxID=51811 RepID=A0ABY6LJE5_9ARAC|nr:DNHD1 [Cordylochernes scorpioides]
MNMCPELCDIQPCGWCSPGQLCPTLGQWVCQLARLLRVPSCHAVLVSPPGCESNVTSLVQLSSRLAGAAYLNLTLPSPDLLVPPPPVPSPPDQTSPTKTSRKTWRKKRATRKSPKRTATIEDKAGGTPLLEKLEKSFSDLSTDSNLLQKVVQAVYRAGLGGGPVVLYLEVQSDSPQLDWLESLVVHGAGALAWLASQSQQQALHSLTGPPALSGPRLFHRVAANLSVVLHVSSHMIESLRSSHPGFFSGSSCHLTVPHWTTEDWATVLVDLMLQDGMWVQDKEGPYEDLPTLMPGWNLPYLLSRVHAVVVRSGGIGPPGTPLLDRLLHWCRHFYHHLSHNYQKDLIGQDWDFVRMPLKKKTCHIGSKAVHIYFLCAVIGHTQLAVEEESRLGLQQLTVLETLACRLEGQVVLCQDEATRRSRKSREANLKLAASQDHYDKLVADTETVSARLAAAMAARLHKTEHIQRSLQTAEPEYAAAVRHLTMVLPPRLEEIRSYRVPPPAVARVIRALCVVFGRPQRWEHGRQLVGVDKLALSLPQLDRGLPGTPATLLVQLDPYVRDPAFTPEAVGLASEAAAALCAWILAVHSYLLTKDSLSNDYDGLEEVCQQVRDLEAELEHLRSLVQAMQEEVDGLRQCAGELDDEYMAAQTELAAQEASLAEVLDLRNALDSRRSLWTSDLIDCQNLQLVVPGNAILLAATLTYCPTLDSRRTTDLLLSWRTTLSCSLPRSSSRDPAESPTEEIDPDYLLRPEKLEQVLLSETKSLLFRSYLPLQDPLLRRQAALLSEYIYSSEFHLLLLDPLSMGTELVLHVSQVHRHSVLEGLSRCSPLDLGSSIYTLEAYLKDNLDHTDPSMEEDDTVLVVEGADLPPEGAAAPDIVVVKCQSVEADLLSRIFRTFPSAQVVLSVQAALSDLGDPCEERPKSVTTPETIQKLHNRMLDDNRARGNIRRKEAEHLAQRIRDLFIIK